jgi:hypothetical protein
LLDVSRAIANIADLRPGDALDYPDRHVRLVKSIDRTGALRMTTLESTTDKECEGVCEKMYRWSELNGYVPIRYLHVVDDETR